MRGALALHRGVLWAGWHEKTAHVAAFDLDGRRLAGGFCFRDRRLGRSSLRAIGVDDDRNLWIADEPASRVRRFSLFGRELGGLGLSLDEPLVDGPRAEAEADVAGRVRRPSALAVRGDSDGLELWVGSAGTRRHAVQLFTGEGALVESVRPLGSPNGRFAEVAALDCSGRLLVVAERAAGRVQVFRDRTFLFAFQPVGAGFRPSALALLEDGRLLVAGDGGGGTPGGVFLCDASGRVLRCIAPAGEREGEVDEPLAVVVERGEREAHARVAVLDRCAERVQVLTLSGRSLGAFPPRDPSRIRAAGSPGERP